MNNSKLITKTLWLLYLHYKSIVNDALDVALDGLINATFKGNNGYMPAEDMNEDLITTSSVYVIGGTLIATNGTFG